MLSIPFKDGNLECVILYDALNQLWNLFAKGYEDESLVTLPLDIQRTLSPIGMAALNYLKNDYLNNGKAVVNNNICRCSLQDILMLGTGHQADCPEKKVVKRYRY
jgi:hypothetical protein